MSVGIDPEIKLRIVNDFKDLGNKTKVGQDYSISARTVGRIIKEYEWTEKVPLYRDLMLEFDQLIMPENKLSDALITDKDYEQFDLWCANNDVYEINEHSHIDEFIVDIVEDTFGDVIKRATTGNVIIKEDDDHYLTGTGVESPVGEVSVVDDETTPMTSNWGDLDAYEWNLIATAQSITVTKTDKETSETESVEIAKGTDNFRNAWAIIREIDMSDEDQVAIGADEIYAMADPKLAIEKFSQGRLTVNVKTETVYYDGTEVHNSLTDRIVKMAMMRGVEGVQALMNFLEKLMENPSYRAVNSLYDFLVHNDIEINSEGNFYAWKRVNKDYTDVRTGTFDNSIGSEPSMPRNMVNEDIEKTCEAGLHVCAKHYLPHYPGNVIIKCEVDPRNVVSIPKDYNNSKMRTCSYKVVENVTGMFD